MEKWEISIHKVFSYQFQEKLFFILNMVNIDVGSSVMWHNIDTHLALPKRVGHFSSTAQTSGSEINGVNAMSGLFDFAWKSILGAGEDERFT